MRAVTEMLNSNDTPSVTYVTPSGMRITIYNPRDCYLTWANGEVLEIEDGIEKVSASQCKFSVNSV